MAEYLDTTKDVDLSLIPEVYREVPDLDVQASEAQASVLRFYTRRVKYALDQRGHETVGLNHRVYLQGYKADPTDVVTADYPNFVQDFKRAVVAVLVHSLNLRKRDPGTVSETDASGKSRVFRPDASEAYPVRFSRILENYDNLEATWGW